MHLSSKFENLIDEEILMLLRNVKTDNLIVTTKYPVVKKNVSLYSRLLFPKPHSTRILELKEHIDFDIVYIETVIPYDIEICIRYQTTFQLKMILANAISNCSNFRGEIPLKNFEKVVEREHCHLSELMPGRFLNQTFLHFVDLENGKKDVANYLLDIKNVNEEDWEKFVTECRLYIESRSEDVRICNFRKRIEAKCSEESLLAMLSFAELMNLNVQTVKYLDFKELEK